MNGIRTLVLQDLPHILPSRGRQLHASVSCRRIWNFFDFSPKEDASYRTPTKCTSSKDISSLLSSNEFKSISINRVCLSAGSPSGPNLDPKVHVYHFDQKSKSAGSPKVPRPLSQPDNLVSLLDGNPVPKTMKWKLKGYKTLRNEESSDFAFVPGGNPYDLDILSRNKQGKTPEVKKDDTDNKDTLCLTNRAIENKMNVMKSEKTAEPNEIVKSEGISDSLNEQSVATGNILKTACNKTPGETTGGMLTTSVSKMKDQYLPISKNELSTASKAQCQLPQKVQYSSQSSNSISKPLPPGMSKDEQLMDSSKRPSYVDKPMSAPSAESYQQRATEVHVPQESPPQTVASGYMNSKWLSMEQQGRITEQKVDDLNRANNKDGQIQTSRFSLPVPEKKVAEPSVSVAKSESKYFAPRRWNYPNVPASNLSFNLDSKTANESILSVLPKYKPLKISGPQENYPVGMSPCAATRARLQAAVSKELQSGFQNESQGQTGSPGLGGSMTGGSEGGSRKPPAYCPSITMKRSTSNVTSLTKNMKRSQTPINKNSASNISTSSACLAPKKCKGEEEMTEGKTICTKPRQNKGCKQRRKKKEKKVCKRYCCPELQESMDCNFSDVQCPKDGKKQVVKSRGTKDPTCLSNEKDVEREGGREICTKPRRRENDRERSCSRERRRRSCSRNESCSRKRSRSCKRQERRDCSRNREDQGGREICTKPKKRESCNRQRGSDRECGQRSAKCSGRRNFTHSAFTGRRKSTSNMRRYSSLPAFAISLIGMKSSGETKRNLFDTPVKGRFYGKQPPSCKSPKSSEKCEKPASNTDVKCKSAKKTETACKSPQKTEDKCKPAKRTESICKTTKKTEPKCKTQEPKSTVRKYEAICKSAKKTDSKCKVTPKKAEATCKPAQKTESKCKTAPKKTESKCKTTPKKTETTCKSAKKTESKCKVTQKKSDPCKVRSKSDDHCAKKREQVCKDRKTALSASSQAESAKDRMEREKKEMEECKKHIKRSKKGKDKKKAENMVPKGLERVVSPCKQKQSGKGGKDPSRKMSCVGVPLDCLTKNTIGHVIPMSDNKSFAILPDRHYSMMRSFSDDQLQSRDTKSGDEAKFWMNNEDEFGPDAIPVPIETENEDEKLNNNNIYSNPSWFTSWFDNDQF